MKSTHSLPQNTTLLNFASGGACLAPEVVACLPDVSEPTVRRLFNEHEYGQAAQKVGQGGRQAAWFLQAPFGAAVLRHYRRGGLVAKLSERSYIWLGVEQTRPWREFQIMSFLHHGGVAVPKVLAGAWQRQGFCYQASLITARLHDTQALAVCLDDAYLQPVAMEIVRMHKLGVWHADLNAYNILLDEKGAWLIDFDRARQVPMTPKLVRNNLLRLRRSLQKVQGEAGEQWWQKFHLIYSCLMQS